MAINTASANMQRRVTGIISQDKAHGSREILVHLQDSLPFSRGELKPQAQTVQVQTQDAHQGGAVGQVTETNVIRAVYKGDPMSDLPPNVVKGEQVELILDSNTNTVYWVPTGRNAQLRARDAKELRVPNQEGYSKTVDDANSYVIRVDTITTKEIRLQTSKTDGEKYIYTIVIKPKENTIKISDNDNNEIGLETTEEHIWIRNKSQSIIDMMKENITIGCKDTITMKAEKQIVFDTPLLTHENSKGDACTVFKSGSVQINASKSFNVDCPAIGLHGAAEIRSIVTGGVQSNYYSTGNY